jgi:hypothetical protein
MKLRDLLNEAKMPKVLYHSVVSEKVRDFVLKNGIKKDSQSMVYLSTKPITRPPFKYVFKVKVPDMNRLWDWSDYWDESSEKQSDPKNPYYIYETDIPKAFVELIKK